MASFTSYFVLVLALAVSSEALTCYSCDTQKSMACGWGIASFTYDTVDCGSLGFLDSIVGPSCVKLTAKNKEGKEYIHRGCLAGPAVGCQAVAKTVGWVSDQSSNSPDSLSDMNCETCSTDKCNSASTLAGFTLFGVLMATLAFLF
ncbi:uncharacterized protein LOC109546495 [Dendroctonus ponderosae]